MIRTLLYDRKTGESRWGDAGLIAEWTENADLWIWADFSDEEPGEESRLLHEAFGLHPLVIADARVDGWFFISARSRTSARYSSVRPSR